MADRLVVQLIESTIDEENEELIEHYISFLKSISIRLDAGNLSLFYNKVSILSPRNSAYSPSYTRVLLSTIILIT